MDRIRSRMSLLLAFLMFLLIPAVAGANTLTILDVVPPAEGGQAEEAKISVYFSLRQGDGMPITGINADNCSVNIDGNKPEVIKAEVRDFAEGDRGVGVLFVFPVAKNYSEDSFGIRSTLGTLVQLFKRDIDMLNAITYDSNASATGWSKASESTLSRAISEMSTTDVLEPNLFSAFQPAISMLENVQNVSQKYIVFISDAEGAIVGERDRANQLIGTFTDQLKKNHITPIIVGYSPDGSEAMTNVSLIKRIAINGDGVYYQAENLSAFQQIIQRDVYNYIFKQYIYDATINMDGSSYLDEGKYNLQLVVKTNNGEDKNAVKVTWPDLKKNHTTLFVILGIILFLGAAAAVVIVVLRRGDDDEDEEEVETGPVCCSVCGKEIPARLSGFKGEFCLSGGKPDCPYYNAPDKGKLQVTRGQLADVTFFIKKEVTTIGASIENDIYLPADGVSRKHAAIKLDDGMRYEIRDFGSANGLYINNEKVERKFLKGGDIIKFGMLEVEFKLK